MNHLLFIAFNKDGYPYSIWEEYYGSPAINSTKNTYNTNISISSNFFLLSSNFKDLSDGAIYCNKDYIKFLHSLCTFTNVRRQSSGGGSIYFLCNSSIVQDKFCSIRCYVSGNGLYSFANVISINNKNYVNLSSLYQCGRNNIGNYALNHVNGNKTLVSTNITQTKCRQYAGYYFNTDPVNVNYCCFDSNENPGSYASMGHIFGQDSSIKRSLFLRNQCLIGDSYDGLISCQFSNLTISECIFIDNKANFVFSAANNDRTVITVINCFGHNLTASSTTGGKIYTN